MYISNKLITQSANFLKKFTGNTIPNIVTFQAMVLIFTLKISDVKVY